MIGLILTLIGTASVGVAVLAGVKAAKRDDTYGALEGATGRSPTTGRPAGEDHGGSDFGFIKLQYDPDNGQLPAMQVERPDGSYLTLIGGQVFTEERSVRFPDLPNRHRLQRRVERFLGVEAGGDPIAVIPVPTWLWQSRRETRIAGLFYLSERIILVRDTGIHTAVHEILHHLIMSWIPDLPKPINEGLTEALCLDFLGATIGSYPEYVEAVRWICDRKGVDARGLLRMFLREQNEGRSSSGLAIDMSNEYMIETHRPLHFTASEKYGALGWGTVAAILMIEAIVVLIGWETYTITKGVSERMAYKRLNSVISLCESSKVAEARELAKKYVEKSSRSFPFAVSKVLRKLTDNAFGSLSINKGLYRVVNFLFSGDPDDLTRGHDHQVFISACCNWYLYDQSMRDLPDRLGAKKS